MVFPILKTALSLRFIDALSSKSLQPLVRINKRVYEKGMKLAPGKYKLEAILIGYENFLLNLELIKG